MRQVKYGQHMGRAMNAAAAVALTAAAVAACGTVPTGPTSPARATSAQKNVPPFYAALVASKPLYPSGCDCPPPTDVADIRATTTGAVLARIKPPRPYTFSAVSGAADDRTFVLFGEGPFKKTGMRGMYGDRSYSQRLFLLRIKPAASNSSATAELTALPQTDIAPGQQLQAIALSPDGKSLAAILTRRINEFPYLVSQLTVFNVANRTQRTWAREVCYYGKCVQGPIGDWPSIVEEPSRMQLSWTSDGRSLLFIAGPTGSQVRLLNVDAPGRNVMVDSYPLPVKSPVIMWRDAVITPDAKSVFIGYNPLGGLQATLMRFSATTGNAAEVNHVLLANAEDPTGYGPDDVLWTNFNGSKFIVLGAKPGPRRTCPHHVYCPQRSGETAGVYSGTRYTPLPWPGNVVDAAW